MGKVNVGYATAQVVSSDGRPPGTRESDAASVVRGLSADERSF
jgi:hypothetical protein